MTTTVTVDAAWAAGNTSSHQSPGCRLRASTNTRNPRASNASYSVSAAAVSALACATNTSKRTDSPGTAANTAGATGSPDPGAAGTNSACAVGVNRSNSK